MVGIKLKLSTSGASITSTNSGNAAAGSSSHTGTNGDTAQYGEGAVAGPSTYGTPSSANGHGHGDAASGAGTPHTGVSGSSTPSTGKRKRGTGTTAAKGTTSRKSLPVYKISAQEMYSKRAKHDVAPIESAPARPSAIPAYILQSEVGTPVSASTSSGSPSPSVMAPPPLPSPSPNQASSPLPGAGGEYGHDYAAASASGAGTPATPAGSDIYVKDEPLDSEDVDMVPQSPDPLSTPMTPADESSSYPFRGRTGGKVNRLRKPLKVLAEKILGEMVKKDDYDLFSRPVSTEEYPDYFTVIGGPQNAMDIGTMREKLENGEYRTLDDIEEDMRTLATAAMTYNPPGSKPFKTAAKLLQHGLKHIERSRAIVMTPSPSPPRQSSTPWRGHSVTSGREATQPPITAGLNEDGTSILPPKSYIPVEMLSYPPNSLQGRAVAWSLTGGKRVWAKRDIRAREKFSGRWRRWGVDGSREVDDMDDLDDVFYASRFDAPRGMNPYTTSSRKVRHYQGDNTACWEWSGFGGATGQPPVPFTPFPLRPHIEERELDGTKFGIAPQIDLVLAKAKERLWLQGSPAAPNQASNANAGGIVGTDGMTTATWGSETNDADIIDQLFNEAMNTRREPEPIRPWHAHYVERAGLTSKDWLVEMAGGLKGVAYIQSMRIFAKRARDDAFARARPGKDQIVMRSGPVQEPEPEGLLALDDLVEARSSALLPLLASTTHDARGTSTIKPLLDSSVMSPELLKRIAQAQHRNALRYILQPSDYLDFAPLFRKPSEFHRESSLLAEPGGLLKGSRWVGDAIAKINAALLDHLEKERRKAEMEGGSVGKGVQDGDEDAAKEARNGEAISSASVSTPVDDAPKPASELDPYAHTLQLLDASIANPNELSSLINHADIHIQPAHRIGAICQKYPHIESASQRPLPRESKSTTGAANANTQPNTPKQLFPVDMALLRLELIALAKHYALTGVKKFTKEDAERLLPPAIHRFLAEGGDVKSE